jgi:hypothetical protein
MLKGNVLPVVYYAPHHEGMGGVEVLFHLLVISALNRGEWSDSHPGTFTPRESAPWYSLNWSLGGPQSLYGLFVERKISCVIVVSFAQLSDQLWAQLSLLHIEFRRLFSEG